MPSGTAAIAAGCLSRKPAPRSAPARKSSGRSRDELRRSAIAHAQMIGRFISISPSNARFFHAPPGLENTVEERSDQTRIRDRTTRRADYI